MYQRKYLSIITERLEKEARRFIQVIYGPRQVGKTTLAEQFMSWNKQNGRIIMRQRMG